MMMNAMIEAVAWVAIASAAAGSHRNAPRMRLASAGSPIQPRPSEARVIPSWVAEM
ncbi:MAG TPA: hypothetical protein VL915_01170 [Gemmatimonadales bacterium]|nr:hypothetical protein [Gemmatimonadales bacterium]